MDRYYNPAADIVPPSEEIPSDYCRRIVIVDGMNVVYASTSSRVSGMSSIQRKDTLVHEFVKRGYEVLVTLGRHFRDDVETENSSIFDELERMEILTYIEQNKQRSAKNSEKNSYDDEVILHSATEYGAAIVSKDRFAEYTNKWPDAIKRRIGYEFRRHKNELFERFQFTDLVLDVKFDQPNSNVTLCHVSDSDYEKVRSIYRKISPNYFKDRLRKLEMIADFIRLKLSMVISTRVKLDYFNTELVRPELTLSEFIEKCAWRYNEGKEREYS